MFCPNCGNQISDTAQFCPKCGHTMSVNTPSRQTNGIEGVDIAAFFIPLIGFVMYFVWKDDKPDKAKKVCTASLVGFVIWFTISMLGYM